MERPVDARFTRAEGGSVSLSSYRGKPAVLFYEDRDSSTLNKALKDRLFKEGRVRGLLDAVHIVAVAYLKSFNFFPARDFALAHVRGLQKKIGVPIHVDFDGSLTGLPLYLPAQGSTIVLLDRSGLVVFRHTGIMGDAEIDDFLARITATVARR